MSPCARWHSWHVDAAVLPTNVSIPGFFFLSFCVLLISDLSSKSSPVPALSSESPHLLFSVLTTRFFFSVLTIAFPLFRLDSVPLGRFSPSRVVFLLPGSLSPPPGSLSPFLGCFFLLLGRFFLILGCFFLLLGCLSPSQLTFPPF